MPPDPVPYLHAVSRGQAAQQRPVQIPAGQAGQGRQVTGAGLSACPASTGQPGRERSARSPKGLGPHPPAFNFQDGSHNFCPQDLSSLTFQGRHHDWTSPVFRPLWVTPQAPRRLLVLDKHRCFYLGRMTLSLVPPPSPVSLHLWAGGAFRTG
jgi:hypothetical protein